jgi:hypothetical protein
VILVAAGLAIDEGVQRAWEPVTSGLDVDQWIRANLSKPSPETLRNVLAVSAAGTATILGLVVSISLIAWQTTADRYRSSSIVAFLLRERMGSAVVRLLALSFMYSLCVLALLEVFRFRPYASTAIAVLLSIVAVLSLLSYRQLGLLGSLPQSIARGLREEMTREVSRAQRDAAGRSVENYSRQVVAADLQIFEDLLKRLATESDVLDIAACVDELNATFAYYAQSKPRFQPGSLFFAQRKEPLGPAGYMIEEAVAGTGLMDPTTTSPDYLWLERRVLEVVDRVATPTLLTDGDIAKRVVRLWATALQLSWYQEDPDAVELILGRIEEASALPQLRSIPAVAEEFSTIPWVMVELAGNGFTVDSPAIVARRPWEGDKKLRNLPWKAQEDGRALAKQIKTELFVTGSVVTPNREQVREVETRRGPRLTDAREQLLRRAVALTGSQLRLAAAEQSQAVNVIAQMSIRTLLRIVHHGLEVPDISEVARLIRESLVTASSEQLEKLQAVAGRAARILAEAQSWSAAYEMLRVSEDAGLLVRVQASDEQATWRPFFDGLITAAIVYGWGEYHRQTDHLRAVGRYVQSPYANLDALVEASAQHQIGGLMFPNVVHFQWAQPLTMAANDLPDRPVFDGGIGYSVEKEHPSQLFAKSDMLGVGPMECLEVLIEATAADRLQVRHQLLSVLVALIEKRQADGT